MRRAIVVFGTVVLLLSASLASGHALARTPTPTATASPTPTSTPSSPGAIALSPDIEYFTINLWVNGNQDWQSQIVAKIGGVVCGTEAQSPGSFPDSGVVEHVVQVKSDALIPGCGKPGASITFLVNGRPADRIAEWSDAKGQEVPVSSGPVWSGGSFDLLTLLVGPSFARVWGDADLQLKTGDEKIIPYIGETACGYLETPWMGEAPPYGYTVAVYSRELQPGCGYEGATITFKEFDTTGKVLLGTSAQTAIWHAWDGTGDSMRRADLTFTAAATINIGGMGDGSSRAGGAPFDIALGLAVAGVAALAAGAALRKRASQRDRARIREG
ncbi:MAG: hypothetical protein ABSC13_00485 [Dehalococcoidia bacterium]|jgi:hypothetical protein